MVLSMTLRRRIPSMPAMKSTCDPGSIPNFSRNSFGMVICPFVVTSAFIFVKVIIFGSNPKSYDSGFVTISSNRRSASTHVARGKFSKRKTSRPLTYFGICSIRSQYRIGSCEAAGARSDGVWGLQSGAASCDQEPGERVRAEDPRERRLSRTGLDAAVVFLASPLAKFITGANLGTDLTARLQ